MRLHTNKTSLLPATLPFLLLRLW